jgi:hypothetical protein
MLNGREAEMPVVQFAALLPFPWVGFHNLSEPTVK